MIQRLGGGLGAVGLAHLLGTPANAAPHFAPRARRVIHLFMNGGPFGPDLLDPKPALHRYAGQRPAEANLRTERPTAGLMPSPFRYQRRGQSGVEVSELLPHLGTRIDDICVLRSVYTDNPNHGPALYMMNNGSQTPTRPSLGAWLSYGLGTENAELPGYVVLCPGRPVRFAELWTSGFLPSEHQGTYINHTDLDPQRMIPFLRNNSLTPDAQRRELNLMRRLNEAHRVQRGPDAALEARIRTMETAYRMQSAASDAFDIRHEPTRTRERYGTTHFANACLLARRLAERGVRFTQIYYGNGQPWDTHNNHNEQVRRLALDIDRPIAALLTDLKQRGLLDDTLVIWGGEFGRTPTSESGNGRDHNHWGFTMWLAGGGVKGGMTHGASDNFGFRAATDRVHIHDLHATILHLLGFDHERLTYRHAGRDFRLTDVEGQIVTPIL
ncbi:MAG: DUF1501 domain-containing protein [Planctomycetes bacterium]|nr:DUF1501 domain-containing protein [Planctomycetota bacterium]